MTEDCGILDASVLEDVSYDLRHWIPVPDRYVEAVAEAHGAVALAVAVLKLVLFVIALAAEKRRRRKSVRELAAHLPTASRNRAWRAQRYARAFWAGWEERGKTRRTDPGQAKASGGRPSQPSTSVEAAASAAGQIRDTLPDTQMEEVCPFSAGAGTAAGHSRERATTGTTLTDLENPRPHPSRQLDPIQQDPVAHPVEEILPGYLARPLAKAGLRCLTDVSKFSRDGLVGLVPRIARFSNLEAIEGALRSRELSWSGVGWSPPGKTRSTELLDDLDLDYDPAKHLPPEPEPERFSLSPETLAKLNAQNEWSPPGGW